MSWTEGYCLDCHMECGCPRLLPTTREELLEVVDHETMKRLDQYIEKYHETYEAKRLELAMAWNAFLFSWLPKKWRRS